MLQNEKYTGNAILQKTYSTDFLSKKRKVNNGEVPKYYVENSHPAIITKEQFELVQEEFEKRGNLKNKNINKSVFANKVICGDCGSVYTTKTWHSTSKYKRIIFQCSNKYKNKVRCTTPHFYEEELKEIAINAINDLIKDKAAIIENCNLILNQVLQTDKLKEKEETLTKEVDKLSKELNQLVAFNATTIRDKTIRKRRIKQFLKALQSQDELLTEFSPNLFLSLVDRIEVYSKDDIKVVIRNEKLILYRIR